MEGMEVSHLGGGGRCTRRAKLGGVDDGAHTLCGQGVLDELPRAAQPAVGVRVDLVRMAARGVEARALGLGIDGIERLVVSSGRQQWPLEI